MAGVNITKERGQVTGVDLVVLRGNHMDMVKKLNASQLINALFQNEVIDHGDMVLINREHVKGRRQGVEKMLSIIHESGPKAFDGFVESLRMAGFTDMADRLHKEHRSRMLQQEMRSELYHVTDKIVEVETETKDKLSEIQKTLDMCECPEVKAEIQELRATNKKIIGKMNNCQKEIKELNRKLEDGYKNKENEINEIKELNKKLVERLFVVEGRLSDKFNFAKLPPFPRINTDGIFTYETYSHGITFETKTIEGIIRRKKDWDRKREVWLENREDCLDKLLNWWEGKQYENVDVFKRDVKEWRDVLYKCLFSQVELIDSLLKWIRFVSWLPDVLHHRLLHSLYVSLHGRLNLSLYGTLVNSLFDILIDSFNGSLYHGLYVHLFVSLYNLVRKRNDEINSLIDVCKQQQNDVKVEIERFIYILNQIISDEGKDNTGTSKDNKCYICFSGYVDLTSTQTHIARIYKHLKYGLV